MFLPVLSALNFDALKFIDSPEKLPEAVGGARTLEANTAYIIIGEIDLEGDRLIGAENSVLFGFSPEYSILKSTGIDDADGAFITTAFSLPVNNVGFHDFGSEQVLDIDGEGNNAAFDWFGVNFLNCDNIGTIKNVSNFISNTMGLLSSAGLVFNEDHGTISFVNSIFTYFGTGTILTIPSTAVISRRLRITNSAVVVTSGNTGINVSDSATIPDEGYILDVVNFSAGGTYITGVDATSETALFERCRGITNTATRCSYTITNNLVGVTATITNQFYKITGTTVAGATDKFTISENRATYTGSLTQTFSVVASASVDAQNNRTYKFKVAKNGTVGTAQSVLRGRNTDNIPVPILDTVTLSTGDYIEIHAACETALTTILVTDISLIISKIG